MNSRYFSPQELEHYRGNGFVVVRGMYSAAEIAKVSKWIDELSSKTPEFGKEMAYFEDSLIEKEKRVLSRIENFATYHKDFGNFIHGEALMGRAKELLEDDAVLFKEKINFKKPGGAGFTPHQDIQPGWDDYAPFFISVLVTIDKSTIENGCLELAGGFTKKQMIGRRWEPLEGAELEGLKFEPYPMEPGDVAFFDCFVPHQSKPNLTSAQRRNLYLTYNRKSDGDWREKYFADKRKSFPPDNERLAGKEYKFKV